MAKVSVSEESIASMIDILQCGRCNLENDVIELKQVYFRAGGEWNDKQYRQLGDLIERVCRNILIIGCKLGEAKGELEKLQDAIASYIQSSYASSSENANAYARVEENILWNTIDGEHTVSVDLRSTNPNYEPNSQWAVNCQRCVPAYEMRRRGYDVTATPKPPNVNSSDLSYQPFAVWENPIIQQTTGNGQQDIEIQMAQWGDGARAQITVVWADGDGGHTFIAEQENGHTRFLDPQTGSENASWYFSHVLGGATRFCRIDNLNTTNRINDCCQEVRHG